MTAPDNVHVAILAGGSGTRFWPASRAARPKQMLPLAGAKPLLRETYERLSGWVPDERIGVITAARHVDAVRELLPELSEGSVIGEPRARNTAAACALACHWAASLDPDAVVVILPADHVIRPTEELQSVLDTAARRAHVNELRYCYELGLKKDPKLTGSITLKFVISKTGTVTSSTLTGKMGQTTVEACSVKAVKRWKFPSNDDGVVVVEYPLTFSLRDTKAKKPK